MTERSVKTAVCTIRKVYEDAFADAINEGAHEATAEEEAARAAIAALPLLDSVQGVREYIGCISWLQGQTNIDSVDVRSHMYTAQVALQALNVGNPRISPTQKQQPRKAVKNASIKKQPSAVR